MGSGRETRPGKQRSFLSKRRWSVASGGMVDGYSGVGTATGRAQTSLLFVVGVTRADVAVGDMAPTGEADVSSGVGSLSLSLLFAVDVAGSDVVATYMTAVGARGVRASVEPVVTLLLAVDCAGEGDATGEDISSDFAGSVGVCVCGVWCLASW
jgi:hypothetical protein